MTTDILVNHVFDGDAYERLLAEEGLILQGQMLIQRALNERGMTQKELAAKLGVGESYVSQMFSDAARNLTLRTIARVLHALGFAGSMRLDGRQDDREEHDAVASTANGRTAEAEGITSLYQSKIWSIVEPTPSRKKARVRHANDARAYAAYDPSYLAEAA